MECPTLFNWKDKTEGHKLPLKWVAQKYILETSNLPIF